MTKKRIAFIALMIIGVGFLLAGALIFTSEEMKVASGLSFGLSASIFGLGAGWFIRSFTVSQLEDQKIKKQKEIDVKDERNTRIRERTGYMVAKVMNYVLSAFILVLAFLRVDSVIIFLAVTLLIIEFGLAIYFSNHYAKTM